MTIIKIKFHCYPASDRTIMFFEFMEDVIAGLKNMGKARTSEAYETALESFRRFRSGKDLTMNQIDMELMASFEAYLKNRGVCQNSSSFYMRILRAVYNRAVDKEFVEQRFPFKHVYTGVDKTVKRALPLNLIKQIKNLDLNNNPSLCFARDMFMFSFYTRGMSFVDMAYLRKSDLSEGLLSYRRRKTGQQLFIGWEPAMAEIVERYSIDSSPYLLPLIRKQEKDERVQYINASHKINLKLKTIGSLLGMSAPLTMYVARHSWASIARDMNVSMSIISEGMGHDSEKTTRIYLSAIDNAEVNNANRLVISSLIEG